MKFVLLSLSAIAACAATTAFAADYSGCAPKVYPKSRPEYKLNANGTLAMDRGNPDVIKAESRPEQDVYVTRYTTKPVKNQVQELNRENGRALALRTYFTDAKGQRTGDATTRYFGFAGNACYLREVEYEGEGSDGLQGTFVTYEQKFCDKLLGASEGMKESARDIARVGKLLADYDNSLQANGRRLFGYEEGRMKKEGAEVIASIVGTCNAIGSSYERPIPPAAKRPANPNATGAGSAEEAGSAR